MTSIVVDISVLLGLSGLALIAWSLRYLKSEEKGKLWLYVLGFLSGGSEFEPVGQKLRTIGMLLVVGSLVLTFMYFYFK